MILKGLLFLICATLVFSVNRRALQFLIGVTIKVLLLLLLLLTWASVYSDLYDFNVYIFKNYKNLFFPDFTSREKDNTNCYCNWGVQIVTMDEAQYEMIGEKAIKGLINITWVLPRKCPYWSSQRHCYMPFINMFFSFLFCHVKRIYILTIKYRYTHTKRLKWYHVQENAGILSTDELNYLLQTNLR